MLLNKLIYPAPDSSYNAFSHVNEMIWIPKARPPNSRKRSVTGERQSKDTKPAKFKFFEELKAKFKLGSPKNHSKEQAEHAKLKDELEKIKNMKKSGDLSQKIQPNEPDPPRKKSDGHKPSHKTGCFKFWIANDDEDDHHHKNHQQIPEVVHPGAAKGVQQPGNSGFKVEEGNHTSHGPKIIKMDSENKPFLEETKEHFSKKPISDNDTATNGRTNHHDGRGSTDSPEDLDASNAFIPCLLLQSSLQSSKILVYFHANCEDISQSYELLVTLKNHLMINILAVEYPGYGIYAGSASTKKVLYDADQVWAFLTETLRIPEKNILLFGRSIGTGPATYLASKHNPGALLLLSAFKSVKLVAKHLFGSLGQMLVKEQFNNLELIADVKCPILLIHGRNDNMVPISHAEALSKAATKSVSCKLVINDDMTHSEFDRLMDMTIPISDFLRAKGILSNELDRAFIEFPKALFVPHS